MCGRPERRARPIPVLPRSRQPNHNFMLLNARLATCRLYLTLGLQSIPCGVSAVRCVAQSRAAGPKSIRSPASEGYCGRSAGVADHGRSNLRRAATSEDRLKMDQGVPSGGEIFIVDDDPAIRKMLSIV